MLTVVTWLWKGWRPVYNAERVNTFCRMFRANCTVPHKIICIAEKEFHKDITECDVYPLWPDWPNLQHIKSRPNCYRRLRLFDKAFQDELGASRIWHWDIDCVIMDSIDHLVTEHPFRITTGLTSTKVNGSMFLLNNGILQHVWDGFDPVKSPQQLRKLRMPNGRLAVGSDQAWISHRVKHPPLYTQNDGVWFFNSRYGKHRQICSIANPCVWFFAGGNKPWHSRTKRIAPEVYNAYKARSG